MKFLYIGNSSAEFNFMSKCDLLFASYMVQSAFFHYYPNSYSILICYFVFYKLVHALFTVNMKLQPTTSFATNSF